MDRPDAAAAATQIADLQRRVLRNERQTLMEQVSSSQAVRSAAPAIVPAAVVVPAVANRRGPACAGIKKFSGNKGENAQLWLVTFEAALHLAGISPTTSVEWAYEACLALDGPAATLRLELRSVIACGSLSRKDRR